ncbi:hypothetical protein [Hyphomonas sp.]|uniref:hypothetical protein n=1 Tax=Hyphomonas sp. TaxID=87 RepID=UPI0033428A5A
MHEIGFLARLSNGCEFSDFWSRSGSRFERCFIFGGYMRTMIKMVAFAAAAIALTACTTTEQVAVEEASDFNLSCSQIEGEIAQLNSRMDSLFFWPAEDGEMNAAEVERRRAPLVDLYEKKGCVPSPP